MSGGLRQFPNAKAAFNSPARQRDAVSLGVFPCRFVGGAAHLLMRDEDRLTVFHAPEAVFAKLPAVTNLRDRDACFYLEHRSFSSFDMSQYTVETRACPVRNVRTIGRISGRIIGRIVASYAVESKGFRTDRTLAEDIPGSVLTRAYMRVIRKMSPQVSVVSAIVEIQSLSRVQSVRTRIRHDHP